MVEVQLVANQHGKGRVRVLKVTRNPEKHEVQQMEVQVLVKGPQAATSFTHANNQGVLPTDSIKNTVYVLAKKHEFASIEEFATILATYYIEAHPDLITFADVTIVENEWERIITKDSKGVERPHHHAFQMKPAPIAFTNVKGTKTARGVETKVSSGVKELKVLKTTKSSFVNFYKDQYTTLPEVPDRLVSTSVSASWNYKQGIAKSSFTSLARRIQKELLDVFAGPSDVGVDAPAVQYTLYKMGEAVVAKFPEVVDITLTMPNIHNLPVDLTRFNLHNIHPHGEIFLPTDEPHGIIQATIGKKQSRL